MSFKMFKDILHWSKNDLFGWADTWQSFLDGRWFSVCGYRWPNSWDDNTGRYKLHPATVKKLIRDGLAEQIDYAYAGEHWGRGDFKHYPQIKLRLTQKGQGLVDYECKIQAQEDEPSWCCQCRRCMFDSHDGTDYCYEIARNIDEEGNYHDDEGNYRNGQNHEVIA